MLNDSKENKNEHVIVMKHCKENIEQRIQPAPTNKTKEEERLWQTVDKQIPKESKVNQLLVLQEFITMLERRHQTEKNGQRTGQIIKNKPCREQP